MNSTTFAMLVAVAADYFYMALKATEDFDSFLRMVRHGMREAAVEAVKKHPELKVDVLDIELKMTPPQYTIKTLDALREKEPHNDFTLVIGADNLASFQGWREHGRILKEYGVVVFPRKGFHRGHDRARLLKEDKSFRIGLLRAPLVTISSTEIRNAGSSLDHWLM